ncbi:MAG: hypothetical protein WDM89_14445 [Rhizomicrobium sp.]
MRDIFSQRDDTYRRRGRKHSLHPAVLAAQPDEFRRAAADVEDQRAVIA